MKNKSGKKDKNVANSEKGGKGSLNLNSKKKNVECHNCHKKGYHKLEFWAPGGGKEGQGPNQKGKGKFKSDDKKDDKKKESGAFADTKGKEKETTSVEEAWLAIVDNTFVDRST